MASRFESDLLEALADPTRADFSSLRDAWTACPRYQPYGRDAEGIEELHMRVATESWDKAVELAKRLLDITPLSVSLRLLYAQALAGSGDRWEAGDQRAVAHGICKAILRSGDGRSQANALVVHDPSEIKLALDLLGCRALRSYQVEIEGRWYDRVEATSPKGDRDVWFDVTIMHDWLTQAT
ncbi:MAG: DUF4919 domain-containing protein [Proteobacteria bacterium]|nr:DUF4919 domain-containing protein [Pseudomonadota bacterium]